MKHTDQARTRRFRWALAAFTLLLIIGLCVIARIQPAGRPVLKISGVDPVSYFGTARSLLMDGDFDLTQEYATLQPLRTRWNATVPSTGLPGSPFPVGFSILELPFLAAATLAERLLDGQRTGYSTKSVLAWYLGMMTYLGIGLQLMFAWLRAVGQKLAPVGQDVNLPAFMGTLILWAGSTLSFYSLSPMAHVVAFMACTALLLAWWHARESTAITPWLLVGVAAGLAFLCRWQDALLLTLPLVYDLANVLTGKTSLASKAYWQSRLMAAAVFMLTLTPQLLQWHQVYGSWITVPQGDGFISMPPTHIGQVLFSSQHGWLVWTPISALGLLGILSALRRLPTLAVACLLTMAAQIVLIGSVSSWHGHLFGMRYLTSLVPLLGFGLVALWFSLQRTGRGILIWLCSGCAAFTLLFAVQYRLDLIPTNDRLTLNELLSDKLQLSRARARQHGVHQAEAALEQGHYDVALAISKDTAAQYGDNLALVDLASQAVAHLGSKGEQVELAARQARLQALLLF